MEEYRFWTKIENFIRIIFEKPRHCSIVGSQAISFISFFQSFDSFKFGINVWDASITIQIATGFKIYAARRRPFSTIPFLIASVKAQICLKCIGEGGHSFKLYLTIEKRYFHSDEESLQKGSLPLWDFLQIDESGHLIALQSHVKLLNSIAYQIIGKLYMVVWFDTSVPESSSSVIQKIGSVTRVSARFKIG